jgi:hypothetical protein
MLVGSKVVKPLQHKLFGGKLNNARAVLGQKLIRVGINQLQNHIQDINKPHRSPLER